MLQALQDAVTNPDLSEAFLIIRSVGVFAVGGWQDTKTQIAAYGTVSVATQRELDSIPEADRVHAARVFHSTTAMYVTNASRADGTRGTSDLLAWRGDQYRILAVRNYSQRGYFSAIAARMAGD
jgi:hypothetical protein